jgi:hypothetical protein
MRFSNVLLCSFAVRLHRDVAITGHAATTWLRRRPFAVGDVPRDLPWQSSSSTIRGRAVCQVEALQATGAQANKDDARNIVRLPLRCVCAARNKTTAVTGSGKFL